MYTGQTRSSEFHDQSMRPMSGKIKINHLLQTSEEEHLDLTPIVMLSPKDIDLRNLNHLNALNAG